MLKRKKKTMKARAYLLWMLWHGWWKMMEWGNAHRNWIDAQKKYNNGQGGMPVLLILRQSKQCCLLKRGVIRNRRWRPGSGLEIIRFNSINKWQDDWEYSSTICSCQTTIRRKLWQGPDKCRIGYNVWWQWTDWVLEVVQEFKWQQFRQWYCME